MLQHNHDSTPFSEKTHQIVVICDGMQSPANIGAIFRLCDAFGVSELISNTPINRYSNRLRRTARNTENTIKYSISEDLIKSLHTFEKDGFITVALEISEKSVPISKLALLKKNKIALVIGNERMGVSEGLLNEVKETVHIEMYGKNSSMNVAQATAIALYELTKH